MVSLFLSLAFQANDLAFVIDCQHRELLHYGDRDRSSGEAATMPGPSLQFAHATISRGIRAELRHSLDPLSVCRAGWRQDINERLFLGDPPSEVIPKIMEISFMLSIHRLYLMGVCHKTIFRHSVNHRTFIG